MLLMFCCFCVRLSKYVHNTKRRHIIELTHTHTHRQVLHFFSLNSGTHTITSISHCVCIVKLLWEKLNFCIPSFEDFIIMSHNKATTRTTTTNNDSKFYLGEKLESCVSTWQCNGAKNHVCMYVCTSSSTKFKCP